MTKYEIANNICEAIEEMNAEEFIQLLVTQPDEEILDDLKRGYLVLDKETLLELDDGRVLYQNVSMGGSYKLYFKIKEIEQLLKDKVEYLTR
jgi:hypothetical protein